MALCHLQCGPRPTHHFTLKFVENAKFHILLGHSETICILIRSPGKRSTNLRELKLTVIEEEGVREDRQFSLKIGSTP